jgi:hypothetical protein
MMPTFLKFFLCISCDKIKNCKLIIIQFNDQFMYIFPLLQILGTFSLSDITSKVLQCYCVCNCEHIKKGMVFQHGN